MEFNHAFVEEFTKRLRVTLHDMVNADSSPTVQAAAGPVPASSTSAKPEFESGKGTLVWYAMTPPREHHLRDILSEIGIRVGKKYRAGQAEHGGDLWKKPGILDMAIDEAVDQLVYLLTLKGQNDGRKY